MKGWTCTVQKRTIELSSSSVLFDCLDIWWVLAAKGLQLLITLVLLQFVPEASVVRTRNNSSSERADSSFKCWGMNYFETYNKSHHTKGFFCKLNFLHCQKWGQCHFQIQTTHEKPRTLHTCGRLWVLNSVLKNEWIYAIFCLVISWPVVRLNDLWPPGCAAPNQHTIIHTLQYGQVEYKYHAFVERFLCNLN